MRDGDRHSLSLTQRHCTADEYDQIYAWTVGEIIIRAGLIRI